MSMGKRVRKGGDEQDVSSRWARKYLCYLGRAGVSSRIKRRTRRRERRQARQDLSREAE